MKKILIVFLVALFTGMLFAQQTLKVNLIIQRTAPTLFLKGSGGIIDFNSGNVTITAGTNALTFKAGTLLKLGTDTLSTRLYARSVAGSGGGGGGSMVYPAAGIPLSSGTTWSTSITNNSTNWNTAYTDRLKWDGGATGLSPSTGRTSLGATTIGSAFFTLTNPSAVAFPRINADNSLTARTKSGMQTDLGVDIIQNQLADTTDATTLIAYKHPTISAQTASYTIRTVDDGNYITMNSSSATNLTIPLYSSQAFLPGSGITVINIGSGIMTVVLTGGVSASYPALNVPQNGWIFILNLTTNSWAITGKLQ